jgi:hypothetical protein
MSNKAEEEEEAVERQREREREREIVSWLKSIKMATKVV